MVSCPADSSKEYKQKYKYTELSTEIIHPRKENNKQMRDFAVFVHKGAVFHRKSVHRAVKKFPTLVRDQKALFAKRRFLAIKIFSKNPFVGVFFSLTSQKPICIMIRLLCAVSMAIDSQCPSAGNPPGQRRIGRC